MTQGLLMVTRINCRAGHIAQVPQLNHTIQRLSLLELNYEVQSISKNAVLRIFPVHVGT